MGRITSLTPEVQETICDALRKGATLKCAAEMVGLSESSIMSWRAKGRNGIQPYAEFLNATKIAAATIESKMVKVIVDAAVGGTWQAASWWLERRRAMEWWLQRPGHGVHQGPLKEVSTMSAAELHEAFVREISKFVGGDTKLVESVIARVREAS